MTKIEEVARALSPDAWHQSQRPDGSKYFTLVLWEKEQARAIAMARRAVVALRNPSEAQYNALCATGKMWRDLNSQTVWQTYIDAILAEDTPRNKITAQAIG